MHETSLCVCGGGIPAELLHGVWLPCSPQSIIRIVPVGIWIGVRTKCLLPAWRDACSGCSCAKER